MELKEKLTKEATAEKMRMFQLPLVKDGVYGIGDLWDARTSQSAGHSLFSIDLKDAKNVALKATPLKKTMQEYFSLKTQNDVLKTFNLDGKASLSFLCGKITLECSFNYETKNEEKESSETVIFKHMNDEYKIYLTPRAKEDIIIKDVLDMLQKGDIEATHVVGGMIIGSQVIASIEIKQRSSDEKETTKASGKGSLSGGVMKVLASLEVNASVDATWVNQSISSDTEIKITVNANPQTGQTVTSLADFVTYIKSVVPNLTKNVELYPSLGKGVNGVPIRFLLYPISHYVDMKMTKIYRELTDTLQDDLIPVIAKCKDLMQPRFMKQRILESNNALIFLLESKSKFSEEVADCVKNLHSLARDIFERSVAALAAFNHGVIQMKDLGDIVNEFRNGELDKVDDCVKDFVVKGMKELQKAYIDSNNISLLTKVKFFFLRTDLALWMGKASTRILLEIPDSCPEIYVKQFIDNVDRLSALKVEIGVAMPSMAETVRLWLKCEERTLKFDNEKVGNALDAIDATLNPSPTSKNVFYRIIGSMCGFKIPIDASEIKNLDKILNSLLDESNEREISFADSLCDVTTELRLSRDGPLICLPLGAPDTDFEVVKQFRTLKTHEQFSGVKWMFCHFRITNYHEAPLVLLFQNESLAAICLDKSEVRTLMLQTATSFNLDDIKCLSPAKQRNSMDKFRQRYLYGIAIMCRLNLERPTVFPCTMLDPTEDSMEELLAVVRTTLFNSKIDLMAAVAVNCTKIFPCLEKELTKYGWSQVNKKFERDQLDKEDFKGKELIDEFTKWKEGGSVKVNEAIEKALKEFGKIETSKKVENKTLNKAVEEIIANKRIPENVKQRLKSITNGCESIKAKCGEIRSTLNVETVEESYRIGIEHIEAVIAAMDMFLKKSMPENMAKQLIGTYFKRSKLLASKSDLSSEIDRLAKDFRPYDILYALMKVKYNETSETSELSDSGASNQATYGQKEKRKNAAVIPGDMRSKHPNFSSDDVSSDRLNIIGHEYTFQACGEMYNTALVENIERSSFEEKSVQRFSDHLVEGRAIELISGDTCAVPFALFRAVSRRVCQMRPNLRVCVVTLFENELGQEKSTLLRKLISCKFSASIERHNANSVYMRMLMLPESLRTSYGYDSIIVLNTDGLGWSEQMENSDASHAHSRNWFRTLYVISISNFVIVDDELSRKHQKLFLRPKDAIYDAAQVDLTISGLFGANVPTADNKFHKLLSSLPHFLTQGKETDKFGDTYYGIKKGIIFLNTGTSHRNTDGTCKKNEDYEEDARDLLEALLSKIRKLDIGFDFEFWSHLIGNFTVCSQEQGSRRNCLKEFFDFSSLINFSKKIAKIKEMVNRTFKNHISRATKNKEFDAEKYFETVPSNCSNQCNSCKDLVRFRDDLYNKSRGDKLRNDVTDSYKRYRQLTYKASKVQYERGLAEVLNRKNILHRLQDIVTGILKLAQSNQPDGIFSDDEIKEIEETFLQKARRVLNKEDENDNLECVGELYQEHEIVTTEDQEMVETENVYDRRNESKDNGEETEFLKEIFEVLGDELSQPDCKSCQLEDEGRNHCSLDCFLSRWNEICYQNNSPTSDIKTQFVRSDCDERATPVDEIPRISASELVSLISASKTISEFLQMMRITRSFSPLESFCLDNEIDRGMSKLLRRNRPDYLHKGIQLEMTTKMTMMTEFREKVKLILQGFERDSKRNFHDELGVLLQIYSLKRFYDKINTLGTKWTSRNDPNEILKQLENNYRYVITNRLQSGFSSKMEGELAAKYLIGFVQQIAAKETHEHRIESILSLPWMASSESIRIQYYEELAVEIARGQKTRALQHFRNPKVSIETWFREVVNSHRCKEFETEYETKFKYELKRCLDEIGKFTRIEGIDACLSQYEDKAENGFTHKLFVEESGDNFEPIIDALKFELNRALESASSYTQGKLFPDIWEEEEIQTRLGCTEICLRCGAICWSHRNHYEDSGEFRKHYAYHQPQGLSKLLFFADKSRKLSAAPCSEACEVGTRSKPDTPGGRIRPIPYLEDWKIPRHPHSKCHELMRWFFQELHADIAKEKNVKPPDMEPMKRNGCHDIKLPSILGALRAMKNKH